MDIVFGISENSAATRKTRSENRPGPNSGVYNRVDHEVLMERHDPPDSTSRILLWLSKKKALIAQKGVKKVCPREGEF